MFNPVRPLLSPINVSGAAAPDADLITSQNDPDLKLLLKLCELTKATAPDSSNWCVRAKIPANTKFPDLAAKAIESAQENKIPLRSIVTRVLYEKLALSAGEYLKRSDVGRGGLYNILALESWEPRRANGSLDSAVSELLSDWRKRQQASSDKELKNFLSDARLRLICAALGDDLGTPLGVIRSWSLISGPQSFFDKTALSMPRLRHDGGSLIYPEYRQAAEKIGLLQKCAGSCAKEWESVPLVQTRAAFYRAAQAEGCAPSILQFRFILEHVGKIWRVEDLVKDPELKLNWLQVRAIWRNQLIPFACITPCVEKFIENKLLPKSAYSELQSAWNTDAGIDSKRVDFTARVWPAIISRHIRNTEIAQALEVKNSSEIADPAQLVLDTLRFRSLFKATPPAALAGFAARTKEEFEALLSIKRDEIRRGFTDPGRSRPHLLRIERALWGIDIDILPDPQRVRATEWHRRSAKLSPEEVQKYLILIREHGEKRVCTALGNWIERLVKFYPKQPSLPQQQEDNLANLIAKRIEVEKARLEKLKKRVKELVVQTDDTFQSATRLAEANIIGAAIEYFKKLLKADPSFAPKISEWLKTAKLYAEDRAEIQALLSANPAQVKQ